MKLYCRNCGYEWNYKGKSKYYATCPRCLRKVNVNEVVSEEQKYIDAKKREEKKA